MKVGHKRAPDSKTNNRDENNLPFPLSSQALTGQDLTNIRFVSREKYVFSADSCYKSELQRKFFIKLHIIGLLKLGIYIKKNLSDSLFSFPKK